jgi:hypothetical protein
LATTRADRIFDIIQQHEGRMIVRDIHAELAKLEGVAVDDLTASIVPATVGQENKYRGEQGRSKRFRISGDGEEERGWIGLRPQHTVQASKKRILDDYSSQIPGLIEEANNRAKKQLQEAIAKLTPRQFESNFMLQVLEALGFSSVEITQPTRDGGVDGKCQYSRGLVQSEAYVSAKRWNSKNNVGADEVNRLRGVKGVQDTGIIFTSASFTAKAKEAAEPEPGARFIVLIDGNLIVETCFAEEIGVKNISLPVLSEFAGFDFDIEESGA